MMGELIENIDIKEENMSYQEEIKINENVHIQDKIILSKEDNSEIHQQVFIKEEELSEDEDSDVNRLSDVDCDNESSHINGDLMDIDYKPADINLSLPLAVFFKEEHNIDNDDQNSDRDGTEDMFCDRGNVEETFGHHFMTVSEDPQEGIQGQFEMESTGLAPSTGNIENQLVDRGALCEGLQRNPYQKLGNGLIKCTQCEYTTSLLRKFNFHIKYMCGKSEIHHCNYCSYKCRFKCQIRYHMIAKHNLGNALIECPYCRFLSLSFYEVQDHVQKKHFKPKKYLYCDQCDYKNQSKMNLVYHIAAKHTLEKNVLCHLCDFKCIVPNALRRHMLSNHKIKIPIGKRKRRSIFCKK